MLTVGHINKEVMEDLAWRHVFGRPVEDDERKVIRAFIIEAAISGRQTIATMELTAAVEIMLGVKSRPTADKAVTAALEAGTLKRSADPNNGARFLYRLSDGVSEKLNHVQKLHAEVALVVAAQTATPTDLEAGKEYLSAPIHYHFSHPTNESTFRENIKDRVDRHRKERHRKQPVPQIQENDHQEIANV